MTRQAKLLELNRTALYYKRAPYTQEKLNILNQIDEIYTDNPNYGYRMIHQQLIENGCNIGNNMVLKYMKILGIEALYPHKKRVTTIKHTKHPIYEYLLKKHWYKTGERTRAVKVDAPNEVWSGDITYIRTNSGFMYLAAVIDWNTRAILAYKPSSSMDAT